MSPVERQAIEWECARLIALYANLNDAHRWEDVVALYHPDGLMTRPTPRFAGTRPFSPRSRRVRRAPRGISAAMW